MLSASDLGSKPNSIYFNTETNGGWVSLLIGGERGRKEDNTDGSFMYDLEVFI